MGVLFGRNAKTNGEISAFGWAARFAMGGLLSTAILTAAAGIAGYGLLYTDAGENFYRDYRDSVSTEQQEILDKWYEDRRPNIPVVTGTPNIEDIRARVEAEMAAERRAAEAAEAARRIDQAHATSQQPNPLLDQVIANPRFVEHLIQNCLQTGHSSTESRLSQFADGAQGWSTNTQYALQCVIGAELLGRGDTRFIEMSYDGVFSDKSRALAAHIGLDTSSNTALVRSALETWQNSRAIAQVNSRLRQAAPTPAAN